MFCEPCVILRYPESKIKLYLAKVKNTKFQALVYCSYLCKYDFLNYYVYTLCVCPIKHRNEKKKHKVNSFILVYTIVYLKDKKMYQRGYQ